MLKNLKLENILFLDIETVSAYNSYNYLPEATKTLWNKKASFIKTTLDERPDETYKRAGIYAEFGKIVCITVGYIKAECLWLKSFSSENEKEVLENFLCLLAKFSKNRNILLCAHNGKEFDYPYIARRLLINNLQLPDILDHAGKKPWEVKHLDTMELWKFGDYKHYTSLQLLAHIFNIEDPKDDIDGSEVGKIFWQDHDLERIVNYCTKDVITLAQILRQYIGLQVLDQNMIKRV
jgi:uncharacterized protein YprB with RNaseH-like and TPR domain